MQTFKPSEDELPNLQTAAALLRSANELLAGAKKSADAAKATLSAWLKEKRKVDLDTLSIGEMVNIEGVALIEIVSMNKFDEAGFAGAEPTVHARWVKPLAVKKFKPLKAS